MSGYYTDYTLCVQPYDEHKNNIDAIAKLIEKEIEKIGVFVYGSVSDGWYGNATWYDYHNDMTLLSKRFPNVVFYLEGKGDSYEDFWGRYYYNGMVMYGAIVIERYDFDEKKLVKSDTQEWERYSSEI